MKDDTSPLKKSLTYNKDLNKCYNLRNNNRLSQPELTGFDNKFNDYTFENFFSKFINTFCLNEMDVSISLFKIRTNNNVNLIFPKFEEHFPQFSLTFKVNTYNSLTKKKKR